MDTGSGQEAGTEGDDMLKSVVEDLVEEWPGNKFAAIIDGVDSDDPKPRCVWHCDSGNWGISDGAWLPGSYESEMAAWFAFDFEYEVLRDLQFRKNKEGSCTITLEDLVMIRVREMLTK